MPKQCKNSDGKPPRKPARKPPHPPKAAPKAGKKTKTKEPKKQKTPEEVRDTKSHKNCNLNQLDPDQMKVAKEMWDEQQKLGYKGKRWSIRALHKLTGIPTVPSGIYTHIYRCHVVDSNMYTCRV